MPIDRDLWLKPFAGEDAAPWPCPKCKSGVLMVMKDRRENKERTLLLSADDAQTRRSYKAGEWNGPLDDLGLFCCILICNRADCAEIATVCGEFVVDVGVDHRGSEVYYPLHSPSFIHPAPDVFRVPKKCPEPIQQEIRAAFKLYWCDQSSCVNRIRTAIELLMTDMGVKRFETTNKGKRRRLSLHDRIIVLQLTQPDCARALMALKWLGNAGSHPGNVSKEDALDGFDLLEHVLDERFTKSRQTISRLTNSIIRRKGPRSR